MKGVDPAARALAQDMARRSGVSLAELLNQLLTDGGDGGGPAAAAASAPAGATKRSSRPSVAASTPKAKRSAARPKAVHEASEDTQAALPDAGPVDPVATLPSRLDRVERSLAAVAVLLEVKLDELSERQDAAAERLERLEGQQGSRLEASKALETAIGKVAEQIYEGEARTELQALHTREIIRSLRGRVDRVEAHPVNAPPADGAELARLEARIARIEAAPAPADASAIVAALSALTRRVEEGQQHTLSALRTLGGALASLERLTHGMDGAPPSLEDGDAAPLGAEAWMTPVAEDGEVVAPDAAPEVAEVTANRLDDGTAEAAETSQDAFEAAVRDLVNRVAATEQRSETAINRMGDQVLRLAQSLDSRVDGVERRSDQLVSEVGGEVARIADVVDACLSRADEVQAAAIGILGGRIAAAADPVGDPVATVEHVEPKERRALGGGVAETGEASQPAHDEAEALDQPAASEPGRRLGRSLDWSVESFADAYQPAASTAPQPVEAEHRRALQARRRESALSTPDMATAVHGADPDPVDPPAVEAPSEIATVHEADPGPVSFSTPAEPSPVEASAAISKQVGESVAAAPAVSVSVEMAPPPPGGYQPPSEPVAYPPLPTVRPGSNRELIEQARTAARLSAESKRRPHAEIWSGKSEAKSASPGQAGEPEDVLDLRNGFGLLKPRRRQSAGG